MLKVLAVGNCCCCSVTHSCLTHCNPMDCSTPGFPVLHYLPEFTQTHVHWVSDAIQSSHPLSSPSAPALNLSQHQGLFQWVSSLHQVAKVLAGSAWVFPVNIQGWFPLGLNGLITCSPRDTQESAPAPAICFFYKMCTGLICYYDLIGICHLPWLGCLDAMI